jgi:flagellar basal body rod protein FlgC
MNDAVYKFKRYEDSSLSYTGIDKHKEEAVGGWNTVLTREEYDQLFGSQQVSMSDVVQTFEDLPDNVLSSNISDINTNNEVEVTSDKRKIVTISTSQSNTSNKGTTKQPQLAKVAETPKSFYNATKPDEEKPQIELSAVKPGASVIHKVFGEGIIDKIAKDRIYISFGKAKKMFQYPSAFEKGFLMIASSLKR